MSDIRNLDLDINEYFEFVILGHTYKFKQPNSEELEEATKAQSELDKDSRTNPFFKFITPVSEGAPEFPDIAKKLTMPHWKAFNKMISEELDYGGYQTPKSS